MRRSAARRSCSLPPPAAMLRRTRRPPSQRPCSNRWNPPSRPNRHSQPSLNRTPKPLKWSTRPSNRLNSPLRKRRLRQSSRQKSNNSSKSKNQPSLGSRQSQPSSPATPARRPRAFRSFATLRPLSTSALTGQPTGASASSTLRSSRKGLRVTRSQRLTALSTGQSRKRLCSIPTTCPWSRCGSVTTFVDSHLRS